MEKIDENYAYDWALQPDTFPLVHYGNEYESPVFPIHTDSECRWKIILLSPNQFNLANDDDSDLILLKLSYVLKNSNYDCDAQVSAKYLLTCYHENIIHLNCSGHFMHFVQYPTRESKHAVVKSDFFRFQNDGSFSCPRFHVEISASIRKLKPFSPYEMSLYKRQLARDIVMWQFNSKYSDVLVHVCGEQFEAHRVILASRSLVFHDLLKNGSSDIYISGYDRHIVRLLLHYIYSGKITISDQDEVQKLLNISHEWGVLSLAKACTEILQDMKFKNASNGNNKPLHIIDHEHYMARDLFLFYNDGYYYDIVLCVDDIEIKAHRIILASRSKTFATMLPVDNLTRYSRRITIPSEFDFDAVLILIQYIYGKIWPTYQALNAEHLLKIAEKYAIEGLKKFCSIQLVEELTTLKTKHCLDILLLADSYNALELKEYAIQYFISHSKSDFDSNRFDRIKQNKPTLFADILQKTYEQSLFPQE